MMRRRAISSVVGAVFAVIALTSTVAYVSYSMNTLSQYNQAVIGNNMQTLDIGKEKFQISSVGIINNQFNITVANTGNLPINFTKVWVQNTTDVDWVRSYVPVKNNFVGTGSTLKNIGQNIPLSALASQSYHIKLVTSRGNTQEFNVNSVSQGPLSIQLFTLPNMVPSGFTSTLMFAVTNNMSNNAILTNIVPNLSINPPSMANCVNVQPPSYNTLQYGSTAYFQWTCTITGGVGDSVVFTASIQNGYPGNNVQSTVTINTVEFSGASTTAFTAAGLSTLAINNDQLVLHKESTTPNPSGGFQMYAVPPDSSTGTVLQLDQTNPSFYTNNDTDMTTSIIPAGKWNATLRYISSPLPPSFASNQQADMIFHFNTPKIGNQFTSLTDSSGFSNTMSLGGTPPQYPVPPVTPRDGSGYYNFQSAGQFMTITRNTVVPGANSIGGYPQSTAGWFKTNMVPSPKAVIYRIEGLPNFYEISMNNVGNIVFSFNAGSSHGTTVTCTSQASYNNNVWHQFVAIRDNPVHCQLYMDGGNLISGGSNGGVQTITTTSNVFIGKAPSGSANAFTGLIDDVMHWNSLALSSNQVQDLYNTNYGTAAHKISFVMDLVGSTGSVLIQHVNETSISNYPMSFQDPIGWTKYNTPTVTTWGQYNFTFTTSNQLAITAGERLKFQANFVSQPNFGGQLNMKLDIDNTSISGSSTSKSIIQTPLPSQMLPGYYTFTLGSGNVYVLNKGPSQAWITINSRVVMESLDGSNAYAGFFSNLSTPNGKVFDTTIMPVGTSVQLPFFDPCQSPNSQGRSVPCIQSGHTYRMYVYINGYDQHGNIFLGTQYFGPVKVN